MAGLVLRRNTDPGAVAADQIVSTLSSTTAKTVLCADAELAHNVVVPP